MGFIVGLIEVFVGVAKVVASVFAWVGVHIVCTLVIGATALAIAHVVENRMISDILTGISYTFIGAGLGAWMGGMVSVWLGASAGAAIGPSRVVQGAVALGGLASWAGWISGAPRGVNIIGKVLDDMGVPRWSTQ